MIIIKRQILSIYSLLLLLPTKLAFALPSYLPLPIPSLPLHTEATGGSADRYLFHRVPVWWTVLGVTGILCYICWSAMPKYSKDKKHEKDHRPSPLTITRPRQTEKPLCFEEEIQGQNDGKPNAGADINEIWLGAIRKGQGKSAAVERMNGRPVSAELETSVDSRPRQLSQCAISHLVNNNTEERRETCNFGENPQYHDDSFSFTRTNPFTAPSSPFSARFYSNNVRKIHVKGHKRSTSSPHQFVQQSLGHASPNASNSQFPLPTLRPMTPPGTGSTPGPGLLSTSQFPDLSPGHVSVFRYSRQYSNDRIQQHRRAQSVPIVASGLNGVSESSSDARNTVQESESGDEMKAEGEFQPVMIFEQGQSVTGQRWRRKVTVFRSEVLESLEKEGLITCS